MAADPIFPPTLNRPKTQFVAALSTVGQNFLRDALPLHTWLAIGAVASCVLTLAIGVRLALLIPCAYLLATTADTLLVVLGLKANPRLARVAATKFAARLPAGPAGDGDGGGGGGGGSGPGSGVVVLLIGATSNHPLGILAPGFPAIGEYMLKMQADLDRRRDEYGLLASSAWLSAEQASGNGNMAVMYFRNYEGLHKFAHSDLHRAAWRLWSRLAATHGHVHLWHELFDAPPGRWESIHINGFPNMLTAASLPRPLPPAGGSGEKAGEAGAEAGAEAGEAAVQWVSVAADATRGRLSTSRGRMGASDGTDNDVYGEATYRTG